LVCDPVKGANLFSFFVVDENGQECEVAYTGTKPQDFERPEHRINRAYAGQCVSGITHIN
jgi:hypothetical protein